MKRRDFLTASLALGAACLTGIRPATAVGVSPADALKRLKEGNQRFVKSLTGGNLDLHATRSELAKGQAPFASILGCADSRVPPEMVFDQHLGDLFVVRVAGNLADDENHAVMGSLEFGSLVLGSQLVLVLGHSSCGAVNSAISKLDGGERAPASIGYLVNSIKPAVVKAKADKGAGSLLERATAVNVQMEVARLRKNPVLAGLAKQGKLQVVGGVYDLASGVVTYLE